MQQSLEISSKKNNSSWITFEKLLYSLISSIDFLRVTSHQWLELWRIRRKKIIQRGAIPWWIVPLPARRIVLAPFIPSSTLSSFHRVTYQPVLSVRVHECNAAGQLKGTQRYPSLFLWLATPMTRLIELANSLIEAELWDILYLPGILFLNRIFKWDIWMWSNM